MKHFKHRSAAERIKAGIDKTLNIQVVIKADFIEGARS